MKRTFYEVSRAGSFRRLRAVEGEIAPPSDLQVTVEVKAIGLNFADVFTILGLYKAAPKRNCIPGIEFSGVVISTGRGVTDFMVGDRVMGSIRFGAYTTHLNIDYRYISRVPDEWGFEEGASFIVQALTAYYALISLGNLQPHSTVLIHSGAGGVGLYANRIAKRFSAFTIGTVGNASKVQLLKTEGYDRVIVRSRSFASDLRAALDGRPLDLVLDAVGGKVQRQSFALLATTGRMIAYGLSQFASHRATPNYLMLAWKYLGMPRYNTLRLIESNKSVLGFNLIWLYDRVDMLKQLLGEIEALRLEKPVVGSVFPFNRLPEALRLFQSGATIGKVVVTVP